MTVEREFNAATTEEAIRKAATELGIAAEDVSFQVVDAGSSGFMGIGARDARIVVSAEVAAEEAYGDPPEAPLDDAVSEPEPEFGSDSSAVPDELLSEVKQYVETVVSGLDLTDARLDVYDAGDFVAVDVATEEAGLFIGQKGETIDALQYLANVAVYRDRSFQKRVILDSEGYRQRRIEAIQGMAHRSARRAARERRTVELPPMNPAERRVVHVFLKDNGQVTTASEGAGENRRVRILPT